jgi:hypothetical protein
VSTPEIVGDLVRFNALSIHLERLEGQEVIELIEITEEMIENNGNFCSLSFLGSKNSNG